MNSDSDTRGDSEMILGPTSWRWEIDNGHAWLSVYAADLWRVGAAADISAFSYISTDSRRVFLEEDCDAGAFLDSWLYYCGNSGGVAANREYLAEVFENVPRNVSGYAHHVRSLPSYSETWLRTCRGSADWVRGVFV